MNKKQLIINKDLSKSFLLAKLLHKIPGINKISSFYNMKRHQYIINKLTPLFDYSLNKVNKTKVSNSKSSDIIWIFWWQGKNKMPFLSQKCYKSILRNRGKRKVILITKNNIKRYANIPIYIYKKLRLGEISLTHLSDILRFNLLNNYGGLWIDATVYITNNLDIFSTNQLFTCSGYSVDKFFNISYGRWTGFFIGGPSSLKLFRFMDTFFQEYWKFNDKLIDYFLIDYALNYAWDKNLSNFETLTKIYSGNNPQLFDLQKKLNDKYNISIMNSLLKNTNVFKLSYKKKIKISDSRILYNHLK